MSSTRSVKNLGIIASAAATSIPGTPTAGASYRDVAVATADLAPGWKYGLPPDSAAQNEWMFRFSTLFNFLDQHGVMGWCNTVDYVLPAIVYGSDGVWYSAIAASGPSGAGAQDPTTATAYWVPLAGALHGRPGHTYTANDWAWLDKPGGLMGQWGFKATTGSNFSFNTTFPNACLAIFASNSDAQGSANDNAFAYVVSTSQFFLSTKNTSGSYSNFPCFWFAIGW